jgi:hypothetical protein
MQAKDMPYGTTIGDYEIVRRKREAHDQVGHTVGGHSEPVYGARSSLYLGGFVADDEEVIDFPTVTKLRNAPGLGDGGEFFWIQEPGGQILIDE